MKFFHPFVNSMMKYTPIGILLLFSLSYSPSLWAQIPEAEPRQLDFGTIDEASFLQSYLVIRNTGNKALVLLRADAPKEFTISAGRKIIPAGDTVHLRFSIRPTKAGRFSERINLYHNGSQQAYPITVKGELRNLLSKDLAACVNFDPKTNGQAGGAVIPLITKHTTIFKDAQTGKLIPEASILYISKLTREKSERHTSTGELVSNVPIGPYALVVTAPGYQTLMAEKYIAYSGGAETFLLAPQPEKKKEVEPVEVVEPIVSAPVPSELDERLFKPNNVVFLIDVSGSMKEPDKLPLLKRSIFTLLEPIRPIDKITIVTYGTEARIAVPTVTGNDKERVKNVIDTLHAGGVTAGSKGLQLAYDLAKEHFIDGGNNQIILATDGAFRVSGKDRKMIRSSAESPTQKLILTSIGFGEKEDALGMLGELSQLGGGRLIVVHNAHEADRALLDEIKQRSKK